MLFMKGSPNAPQCGFSRQITDILKSNDIPFASFDILTDERVRSGLKKFSDWPTFPQLYVSGEFVGGLDVVKEIASSGNLASELGTETFESMPSLAFDISQSIFLTQFHQETTLNLMFFNRNRQDSSSSSDSFSSRKNSAACEPSGSNGFHERYTARFCSPS